MNQAQHKLYFREWNKCRQALRKFGYSPKDADAKRDQINTSVSGQRSSKKLNNTHLTKVLAIFWSYSEAARLDLQLRQLNQAAILGRFCCEQVYELIFEVNPEENIKRDHLTRYIDSMFLRLNKGGSVDSEFGSEEEWQKVIIACHYRYDQVVRNCIGLKDNRSQRFWPHQHDDNMPLVLECRQATEPEPAMATTDEGNPF